LRVTPEGRSIVFAVRTEPAGAVVEVRDGGPGLTDADLAVAFERGVLHDRYRGVRPVGSGVGLALVAGLIERMGGRCQARHAPEGGACFTAWLPARGASLVQPPPTGPQTH
jgi:two-component system sensor histidine kinase BaeS